MKRKISIVSLCCLLLSVLLAGATLAYLRQSGTDRTSMDTGRLTGELIQEYTPAGAVYPGDRLEHTAAAKNTGSLDMVVRMRVAAQWGSAPGLDAEIFQVDYNSSHWLDGGDGYYYYKGILKAGKTTPELCETITLKSDAGNAYMEQAGAAVVTLECLQASAGALNTWGKTYEDLGVAAPVQRTGKSSTAVFTENGTFTFAPSDSGVLPGFAELTPGEVCTQKITISNQYPVNTVFYLTVINEDSTANGLEDMLAKYGKLLLTSDDGKVLYSGSVPVRSGKELKIAELDTGASTAVTAAVTLDAAMGNQYQQMAEELQWQFVAQQEVDDQYLYDPDPIDPGSEDNDDEKVDYGFKDDPDQGSGQRQIKNTVLAKTTVRSVKTGDETPILALVILAGISLGISILAGAVKRYQTREGGQNGCKD